jgi:hypothetical protein
MVPLTTVVKSQVITAPAAARQMLKQCSGMIIFLTGSPAPVTCKAQQQSARRSARSSFCRESCDRSQSFPRQGCVPPYDGKHGQPHHQRNNGHA